MYAGFEIGRITKLLQDYTAPLSRNENVFSAMAGIVATASGKKIDTPIRFLFRENTEVLTRYGVASGEYLFVHPFAGSEIRELSQARWVQLLHKLSTLYPHLKILISGAGKDDVAARHLRDAAMMGDILINLSGKCSVQEIASLISHAAAYLGVDTGITHLASVIQAPAVLIGNNSNPFWLPTYSTNTTILTADEHCTCDGAKGGACWVTEAGQQRYRCMVEISDETILDALREKIG